MGRQNGAGRTAVVVGIAGSLTHSTAATVEETVAAVPAIAAL